MVKAKTKSKAKHPAAAKAMAVVPAKELSGKQWVSRFPGSADTADLVDPFRAGVDGFIAALKEAKAKVSIGATFRPRERMYLMHWCWQISKGTVAPSSSNRTAASTCSVRALIS